MSEQRQRARLTAGRISAFKAETGQQFLWDSEVPGLAVRSVAGTELKAFVWQAKLSGNSIRITIGDVEKWGIDQARIQAREFHVMVDKGEDPREVRRESDKALAQRRAEKFKRAATALEIFKEYIEERSPHWGARHLHHHQQFISEGGKKITRGRRPGQSEFTRAGPLFHLLSRPLVELDTDTISRWLRTESVRAPMLTAQAYRAIKTFMTWCAESKHYNFVDGTVCHNKRVKELVAKPRAKEGDCLQKDQLKPWFNAVSKISNPVTSAYLQTLLLTGARREELATLTWEDTDFEWGSLKIHDKVDGDRTIPLTPYVASLLHSLPRRNEWVFSTSVTVLKTEGNKRPKSGRITEPRIAHVKALQVAGLPHISLHGLRRSFGTLAEWVEVPVGIVAQLQGHKPSALAEKHYRRRPLDLLRMWHAKIEEWILKEAGIEFDAEAQAKKLKAVK